MLCTLHLRMLSHENENLLSGYPLSNTSCPPLQLHHLEPELQYARSMVIDLQSQLSASSANWKQLVAALVSHTDPSNSYAVAAIPGREYEVRSVALSSRPVVATHLFCGRCMFVMVDLASTVFKKCL